MSATVAQIGTFLRNWWFLLAAFGAIVIAAIEVRIEVRTLSSQVEDGKQQWRAINRNTLQLKALEEWQEGINKVVTPEGMQEWGAIKQRVPENTRAIRELERRVYQGSTYR